MADLRDFFNWINATGSPLPGGLQAAGDNAPGLSGAWLTGGATHDYDSPEARDALLARLRAVDPNASISQAMTQYGGDDPKNSEQWLLQFDQSKLPAPTNPQGNPAGSASYAPVNSVGGKPFSERWNGQAPVTGAQELYRPDATYQDANYGTLTSPRNIKPPKPDIWSTLGPAIIAAIPTLGASLGIAGMAGLSGLQGAGMGLFNTIGRAAQGGGFDPISAALGVAGPLAGMAGVPSWATQAAGAGVNLARGGSVNPIGAALTIGRLARGLNGNGGG